MKNRSGGEIQVGSRLTLIGVVAAVSALSLELKADDGRVFRLHQVADEPEGEDPGVVGTIAQGKESLGIRAPGTDEFISVADAARRVEELREQFIGEAAKAGYGDDASRHIAEVRLYGYRRGVSFDDAEKAIAAAPGTDATSGETNQAADETKPADSGTTTAQDGTTDIGSTSSSEGQESGDPTPEPSPATPASDGPTDSASSSSDDQKLGDPNDRPSPETV